MLASSLEEYTRRTATGTPIADFFRSVCDATLAFDESVGIPGSTHPDSMTLGCLLHPEIITEKARYRVDVECGNGLTRGYSAMTWDKFNDREPNATVVESADHERFFALLDQVLATETTPNLPMHRAGVDSGAQEG